MNMEATIDTSSVPVDVGVARTVDIPATRYRQGEQTFHSVTLSVADLVKVLEMPDPRKPLEDNRVVQETRARAFGLEYVLRDGDRYSWVCPPMIVRADPGELTVGNVVHEFGNGTAWVVLRVSMTLAWRILDGQHRALGFDIAVKHCTERIRELRDAIRHSEANGQPPEATAALKRELSSYEQRLTEVGDSHVSVTLVEASRDAGKQMFVDIARNAKGVNPDFTTVLDQRSVVHRIAMELANTHPLLKDRVEHGQGSRMSKTNRNLVGAKAVADIVHGVLVGSGRVGRRKEVEIAANESASAKRVSEFLDTLVAGFEDLRLVVGGELNPIELREESLLGSSTMLRVLAVAWHDLRHPDSEAKAMPVGEIERFFQSLSPHMRAFRDVEVTDPVTGDSEIEHGLALDDPLWMPTKVFRPGAKAPGARQGDIKDLSRAIIQWARVGNPALEGGADE